MKFTVGVNQMDKAVESPTEFYLELNCGDVLVKAKNAGSDLILLRITNKGFRRASYMIEKLGIPVNMYGQIVEIA